MAPISSPLDPMNAKYRGRGWAIDSSRIRAVSSSASWTGTGPSGRPARQQLADAVVQRGFLGAEPVEAPPGLGDELGRVLERLLPAARPAGADGPVRSSLGWYPGRRSRHRRVAEERRGRGHSRVRRAHGDDRAELERRGHVPRARVLHGRRGLHGAARRAAVPGARRAVRVLRRRRPARDVDGLRADLAYQDPIGVGEYTYRGNAPVPRGRDRAVPGRQGRPLARVPARVRARLEAFAGPSRFA